MVDQVAPSTATHNPVVLEAGRRRTFAVISHPDAGKSTLTEALALHAQAIAEAGAVHGKGGRKGVVSDWLEMERARGISITSAALQLEYRDTVINLLDTPGHADFSEDTYRVLAAVDCAVMLIDAAKGLEPQTMKLLDVCRHRGTPVITFVNKWDRVGREALDLCEEITARTGLQPMPLNWPVGPAGHFRGLRDAATGEFVRYRRTPGGATVADEEHLDADTAAAEEGADWTTAGEECDLLVASGGDLDVGAFYTARATPVLFGAAVLNIGVRQLLDVLVDLAPRPAPRPDRDGAPRPLDSPSPGSCSRCRPAWTRPIGTAWPSSGLLGPFRARHPRHPRADRSRFRHEIRPADVRSRPQHRRDRLPGRRHRAGQRGRAAGRGHALRGPPAR